MNFEIPIHASLTQVIMIGGVPREIAILNGTLTAALVLGLHSFWGIPVGIILHGFAVRLSNKDAQFLEVFRRQIRQRGYYEG
jgi:type IV secretory pathway TrbD component